jgi:teichuronic acid biosynthesis glycosyltransferase TuaG
MGKTKPTFSIVIPVFNGAAFISRAVESCLQQTTTPTEIIIVDDASTDETKAVVQNIRSELVIYKKNETNRGPAFCRNTGINLATGNWILFLDADDIFHKRKIEIIEYYLLQDPAIKAIGHAFNLQSDPVFEPGDLWKQECGPEEINVKQVLKSNPMVTPSLAVAATNQVLFNEKMLFAEDHDFILRTAEKFGLWYLDMPLCSLSRRPLTQGGISSSRWKMRKGEMSMYISYCKRKKKVWTIPFFILFSLAKHINRTIRNS